MKNEQTDKISSDQNVNLNFIHIQRSMNESKDKNKTLHTSENLLSDMSSKIISEREIQTKIKLNRLTFDLQRSIQ